MTDTIEAQKPAEQGFAGITFLDPADLIIEESDMAGLDVTLDGTTHKGVRATMALPITGDGAYISLRVGETKGEERELGVIRHESELNDVQRRLVHRELNKRYFLHVIHKLVSVKEKFGFIYFVADTDKGRLDFAIRYEYNRVQEYGEHGRMLLDTDDNRYVIPDLEALTPDERKRFTRYIYW